jgi:hypothetical protein
MAKLFDISIPDGASTLRLDSKGKGTMHYTVRSLSRIPIDAKGVLVPVPSSPADPSHPVPKGWVKIDGKAERHFEVNGEDAFTVTVTVPPQGAVAGTYSYRLDVVSAAKPDEGDSSSVVNFKVEAPAPKPKPNWMLIVAIIAAVVVIGGVVTWLALRNSGGSDVKGKTRRPRTPGVSESAAERAHSLSSSPGISLNDVISGVAGAQLVLSGYSGNDTTSNTTDQSIPWNTQVAIGTPITATFPSTVNCGAKMAG